MYRNPYEDSLETRVLSATPLELVTMLYDGAIDAVRAARGHLARREIFERSRAVSKAVNIILELANALDHKNAADMSKRLAGLYNFMWRTLLEANYRQTEEGLVTVENLLVSLREAWGKISSLEANQFDMPAGSLPEMPSAAAAWGAIGDTPSQARHWSA
jgi:flagellar protein FliS